MERAFFAGLPFPSGEASSSSMYSVRSGSAERFDRRRGRFSLEEVFDGVRDVARAATDDCRGVVGGSVDAVGDDRASFFAC